MTKLQIIDAKRMEKLLLQLGFEKTRQKGSHALFRHPEEEPPPFHITKV